MATAAKQKAPRRKAPAGASDATVPRPTAEHFKFGYLVHDVSRIRRTAMDQIMRPYGITRSQWSVLSALSRGGNDGMMQVDLARLMEVGKVTVGGLVDRLEASGHVERRSDASDRRAKRVFITEQGYEVIRLMIAVASSVNRRVLRGLTQEEVRTAEKVLAHAKLNLKELVAEYASGEKPAGFGSHFDSADADPEPPAARR